MPLHEKFWMLLLDTRFDFNAMLPVEEAPRFIHASKEGVESEAERLSIKTGKTVFILEATTMVVPIRRDIDERILNSVRRAPVFRFHPMRIVEDNTMIVPQYQPMISMENPVWQRNKE